MISRSQNKRKESHFQNPTPNERVSLSGKYNTSLDGTPHNIHHGSFAMYSFVIVTTFYTAALEIAYDANHNKRTSN